MPKETLFQRYKITIVMVPAIIAMHFGWNAMQYNRSLVREDEQIELPIVTFAKNFWKRMVPDDVNQTKSSTDD